MEELIGQFTLRNDYKIFRTKDGYKRVSTKSSQEYVQYISNEIYESAKNQLSGREWDIKEEAERLKVSAESENWPIYYGYKFQHFVQDILLVIAANGEADFDKEGRKYVFTVF